MPRPLPTLREAAAILARRRTRGLGWTPPGAGRALAATMKALDARFGQSIDGLEVRWREIVGVPLARRSEPVKLVKSRVGPTALEIRVEGPSATLIQHQSAEIIERVNMFLGPAAVGRLRIVQGPLKGPVTQRPAPHTPRHAANRPLDAAAEKALTESLAALPDGSLKQALTKLGRKVMG